MATKGNGATRQDSPDNKTPTEILIHLIEQENLSITEVAKRVNLNKSSVSKRLKRVNYIPGYLKNLDNAEISMLKQIRHKLLKCLATRDLKKISLQQAATSYAILTDKQLILEGKPNIIVAYADMVKTQDLVNKRLSEFENKYGLGGDMINITPDK